MNVTNWRKFAWGFFLYCFGALMLGVAVFLIMASFVSAYDGQFICEGIGYNLTYADDFVACGEFLADLQQAPVIVNNITVVNHSFVTIENHTYYIKNNTPIKLTDYVLKRDYDEIDYITEANIRDFCLMLDDFPDMDIRYENFEDLIEDKIAFYETELYKREIATKELEHTYELELLKINKTNGVELNRNEIINMIKSIVNNGNPQQNQVPNQQIPNQQNQLQDFLVAKQPFYETGTFVLILVGLLAAWLFRDVWKKYLPDATGQATAVPMAPVADLNDQLQIRTEIEKLKAQANELKEARKKVEVKDGQH